MVKFVRMTAYQRKRERVLKTRLKMSQRMISDVDGKIRVKGHQSITKTNRDLRKLYDKVYKKKR